jgi:transposase
MDRTLFALHRFYPSALMSRSDAADEKRQALHRSRTLNPKADHVDDLHFAHNAFFDARDLVQVKYEMLRRVAHEGWSVSQAARHFGFSRPTYYQAKRAFDEKGLWGLVPQRRGPRSPRKLTEAMLEALVSLRVRDPSLSPAALAAYLDEHHGLQVHPRTIRRRLTRRQKKGTPRTP